MNNWSIKNNERTMEELAKRHSVTEKDILAASHKDLTSVSTEIEYSTRYNQAEFTEVERMISEYGKPSMMD